MHACACTWARSSQSVIATNVSCVSVAQKQMDRQRHLTGTAAKEINCQRAAVDVLSVVRVKVWERSEPATEHYECHEKSHVHTPTH